MSNYYLNPTICLFILLTSLGFNYGALASENSLGLEKTGGASTEKSKTGKWILVLNDPRGERRLQWSGGVGYQLPRNYDTSLSLNRLAISLSNEYHFTLVDQWPIKSLRVHCLVIRGLSEKSTNLARLLKDSRVKWIQPYQEFEGLRRSEEANKSLPGEFNLINSVSINKDANVENDHDPYRQFQPIFENINITELNPRLDGAGVTIAIVDSGVEIGHLDLLQADTYYKNFVSAQNGRQERDDPVAENHGTGVASVIIAQSNNGLGIAGIAPSATLHAFRGCWELENGSTRCNTLSLARALDAIVELSPDILNLSLTGPKDLLLDELIKIILNQGTTVVSAFDENRPANQRFPSRQNGVVFARDNSGIREKTPFSVGILGKKVLTAQPTNTYAFLSGNSLSSAHLSAVFALLKQAKPDLTHQQLELAISSIDYKNNPKREIDVCYSLRKLKIDNDCS